MKARRKRQDRTPEIIRAKWAAEGYVEQPDGTWTMIVTRNGRDILRTITPGRPGRFRTSKFLTPAPSLWPNSPHDLEPNSGKWERWPVRDVLSND